MSRLYKKSWLRKVKLLRIPMSNYKVCFNCGLEKSFSDYAYWEYAHDKRRSICQQCVKGENGPVKAGQKQCFVCAKHLPETNFQTGGDELYSYCTDCQKLKLHEKRKRILEAFRSRGCRHCLKKDIRFIDVDHVRRETKTRRRNFNFRRMNLAELKRELMNCEPLCAW